MDHRSTNLGYFFADSVARFPDRVAVIDLYGGTERLITYGQLDERADRVAGLIEKLGVKPGERVGMIVGNRVEFLEIFFGAMRAGAIPVAINTRLARDTLKFILEDAECRAVFVEPAAQSHAIAVAQAAPLAHRIALEDAPPGWLDYASARDASPRLAQAPALAPDAQAFQPYTSGSTGLPKGAIMTHSGMLWYIHYNQRYWPTQPEYRGLIALPLFHKNAMRGTVKPMLYAGASFVLMPAYEPLAYLDALAKYRCTYYTTGGTLARDADTPETSLEKTRRHLPPRAASPAQSVRHGLSCWWWPAAVHPQTRSSAGADRRDHSPAHAL